MSRLDYVPYEKDRDNFLHEGVFNSYAAQPIASVFPADVAALTAHQFSSGYEDRIFSPSTRDAFLTSLAVCLPEFLNVTRGFQAATAAGEEEVEVRCGRFSLTEPRMQRFGEQTSAFHVDTRGAGQTFFTDLLIVGKQCRQFVGTARRTTPDGYVELIEGEVSLLEEGVVYRLTPVTVHAEAEAPVSPESRYCWRRQHR